jgi:mRNA interferase RelE/StbE
VKYTLNIKRSAQKDMLTLHPRVRADADRYLLALADDPRPSGAIPLKGQWRGLWRLRVGEYRVIYDIDDRQGTVTIAAIGPRESVY